MRKGVKVNGEHCRGRDSTTYDLELNGQLFNLNVKHKKPIYDRRIVVNVGAVIRKGKKRDRREVVYTDLYSGTKVSGSTVLPKGAKSRKRIPLRLLQE